MKMSKIEFGERTLILNYREKAGLFTVKRRKKLYPADIEYISIETCVERIWFRTYLSEKINIKTKRMANKVTYYGIAEFADFQDYKNGLRIFASLHNVTLRDRVTF